jgi:hypothetical protein
MAVPSRSVCTFGKKRSVSIFGSKRRAENSH